LWRGSALKAANIMTPDSNFLSRNLPDCQFNPRLSSFHDGELDAAARQEMEEHLLTCTSCAGQLAEIREVSALFGSFHADGMTDDEATRLHDAVDTVAAPPLRLDRTSGALRIAGFLMAAAASILIISAAWLSQLPVTRSARPGIVRIPTSSPDWESVAAGNMTADPSATDLGTSRLARRDAAWADWVVGQLQK